MNITQERPADAGAIEALLDTAFGPKRFAKTVYKLRAGVDPVPELCFVATGTDAYGAAMLVGTIRHWPIRIGATPALLLGPIAVAPDWRGHGVGAALIRHSLAAAAGQGHRIVLLVGDAPYYARFGFTREKMAGLTLPGPVELDRFLGLELAPGALDGVAGRVGRAALPAPAAATARRRPRRAVR